MSVLNNSAVSTHGSGVPMGGGELRVFLLCHLGHSKLSFSVQSRTLFPRQSLITILSEKQFVKNEVREERLVNLCVCMCVLCCVV